MSSAGKYIVALSLLLSFGAFAHEGEQQEEGKGADMHLLPKPIPNPAKATRPSKVVLESPAALSKVPAGAVTLKWQEAKGAESYQVQVATDPNFKWLVTNEFFVKGNSFELKNVEAGKQYFWRVAGMNPNSDPEYLKGFFTNSMFLAQ